MAQSSPLSDALGTLGGWVFASVCAAASVIYFDEIRAATRTLTGLTPPEAIETAAPRKPAEAAAARSGAVHLRADSRGHFVTSAEINGRTIEVLVDTGASMVALSYEDAEQAGIYVRPSDFTHQSQTANGMARIAPVMIDQIAIGDVTVRNVRGAVSEPGRLNQTLLGMTFLGRLSRAEMRRGELILEE